ncbi:enzymatic poly Endonuclease Reverse [Brachionus plicatilis]|uniref:Enzymatic poly Endonuclease Reverse n=1 Tax=Brachionus plicatilis TaxID=10195 RepID=A0A3M7SCR1_BRAPC|nr:enzymatic poly Endonuclease Reverse [Brachionus plicatilis]
MAKKFRRNYLCLNSTDLIPRKSQHLLTLNPAFGSPSFKEPMDFLKVVESQKISESCAPELIREEYFWKNIDRDVEQYILACDICKLNNLIALKEHPAKTLNIKGISDRIAIDLVFGPPLTEEGFLRVMVFSEYLTKYPYVEPIKRKTTIEIADHLWKFICMFGPPKLMFGRKMNRFRNWSSVDSEFKHNALDERVLEIKFLMENPIQKHFVTSKIRCRHLISGILSQKTHFVSLFRILNVLKF